MDYTNANEENLKNRKKTVEHVIDQFQSEIAKCEEELKAIADRAKELGVKLTDAVQTKIEEVVEVAEVVKEEVKKAAPKKPARKAAAKKEEEAPEKDADSDK